MPKFRKIRMALMVICMIVLLNIGVVLAARPHSLEGWEVSEFLTVSQQFRIRREIDRAAQAYRDVYIAAEKFDGEYSGAPKWLKQADIDAIETRLIDAGFSTVDSDSVYPACLGNPDGLYDFWDAVSAGKNASQTVIRVNEDGGFTHLFISFAEGEASMAMMELCWDDENQLYVWESEMLPIFDMELTDWGIFYYQNYPDDPHYINYNQLRLKPVDRKLYDLNQKYIQCVGYQFTNLFLCDWSEEDFDELCFNDLFEYLYLDSTGQTLDLEQYPNQTEPPRFLISAALFEKTILPYFRISLKEFRKMALYEEEGDCYPWRNIFGDDITAWKYPMCEPEVVACEQNSDGTLTLAVQVYSPELKTDRLFAHEVTVRPLADGKFQFVSNRVTYVSDRGLPPSMPRFALDGE